jgi:hypothetical protein
MNNDEYITKHKVERIGAGVIMDETDLEYEVSMCVVCSIRIYRIRFVLVYVFICVCVYKCISLTHPPSIPHLPTTYTTHNF